jgi:hypothetical protein
VVSDWSCREATRARLAWSVADGADIARVMCVRFFLWCFEKEKKGKNCRGIGIHIRKRTRIHQISFYYYTMKFLPSR